MTKDADDLRSFLPSIAIFGGLEGPSLERVIGMLVEHRLDKGEVLCRQGDTGREMFIVRSGEVSVCREAKGGGRRVRLVRLGRGECFGEMTLIDPQRRSATIVVEQPTVLYALGNRDLYKLFQVDVNAYVLVLQNLCRELSRRLRSTNARLSEMAEESGRETTLIRPAIARKPLP